MVPTERVKRNSTAQAGCKLFLTKPLGIGVLTTAEKKILLKPEHKGLATEVMCQMNCRCRFRQYRRREGDDRRHRFWPVKGISLKCVRARACRRRSGIRTCRKLPGVEATLPGGAVPGSTQRGTSYGHLMGEMPEEWRNLLCDPQTSGGLLLAVTPESSRGAGNGRRVWYYPDGDRRTGDRARWPTDD